MSIESKFRHYLRQEFFGIEPEYLDNNKIYEYYETNKHVLVCDEYTFRDACYGGNIELVKWTWNLIDNKIKLAKSKSNDYYMSIFESACYNYKVSVAKFIVENANIDYTGVWNRERFYEEMCMNTGVDIVKYLYEVSNKINLPANISYDLFKRVCQNGKNMHVPKWIYEVGNFDIHQNNDEIFKLQYNHGWIAEWLCSFLQDAEVRRFYGDTWCIKIK